MPCTVLMRMHGLADNVVGYDLLEATIRQAHEAYVRVVRDADVSAISSEAMTVIKLHGDREQRDTIVLTEGDYETIFLRNALVLTELRAQLAKKTFLFVGYGINDPDLKQIHREIAYVLEGLQPRAYAVVFDDDKSGQQLLRNRNIEPLYVKTEGPKQYNARLGEWLNELVERVWQEREKQQRGLPGHVRRARERHEFKTTPAPPLTHKVLDLHQLDAPPRDFTGREHEIAELERIMEANPLVLLWGMGGSGKRTLALVLANKLQERYPDAQLCCDLSGTSAKLTEVDALGQVIHAYHPEEALPEDPDRLAQLYRAILHDKRVLLLMNDAADEELVIRLKPPPSCAMIVTSRRDTGGGRFCIAQSR